MAQKIVPNIWSVGNATEMGEFYARTFPNTTAVTATHYPTEGLLEFQQLLAGEPLTVLVTIGDYEIVLINAGDDFAPNASISFMVNFDPLFFQGDEALARAALDRVWGELSDGGDVMMPLGEYPFSAHYGFIADRYGVTWQLMLTDPAGEPRPFIIPTFLFNGAMQNRAGDAIGRWLGAFDDARLGTRVDYPEATGPASAGAVMFADFQLCGQWFAAMDSGVEMDQPFTCGVSHAVMCADQAEIDRYWEALSRVPEAEQCGWCADEFGVSWQVVPHNIDELTNQPGGFAAMMPMKKLEIDRFSQS